MPSSSGTRVVHKPFIQFLKTAVGRPRPTGLVSLRTVAPPLDLAYDGVSIFELAGVTGKALDNPQFIVGLDQAAYLTCNTAKGAARNLFAPMWARRFIKLRRDYNKDQRYIALMWLSRFGIEHAFTFGEGNCYYTLNGRKVGLVNGEIVCNDRVIGRCSVDTSSIMKPPSHAVLTRDKKLVEILISARQNESHSIVEPYIVAMQALKGSNWLAATFDPPRNPLIGEEILDAVRLRVMRSDRPYLELRKLLVPRYMDQQTFKREVPPIKGCWTTEMRGAMWDQLSNTIFK